MTYKIDLKPRAEREAMIAKRLEASDEFGETIYDFRSGSFTPKAISLPIDVPVYRMENCRTFSAQQTEIAREGLAKDFFEKGQELTTAQQAQHEILAKLAKQGTESVTPIISVLEKDGQRETILITSTGVVVNGNRRLAAMRELKTRKDGSVDERFTNIKCAVLPPDVTRDEIDDIEADLQARPQTKLDYDWIGDARLIRRQVGKGRSTKEVADRLRRSKIDIENVLQALDEADLYLSEWVKKPGEYDLLQDGQQIFGDLPKAIAKKDVNLQNASRAIAWSIYENRDKISGRVYRLNAAFGKLAPNVLEILDERLELPPSENDDPADDDDFAIDIDDDGGSKDYTPIIEALRGEDADDETITTLIDACETAIELDRGQKNEEAALKALAQVNSKVTGIDISAAGTLTLPAILKQIGSIRKNLDKIESAVNSRQAGGATDTEGEE
jgi:DNA-binding FrmR family transcriptional regulator